MINTDVPHALFDTLAQTLGHFVWQGALAWAAAAALFQIARPRRAQSRYVAYCTLLLLLAACPVITFAVLRQREVPEWTAGVTHATTGSTTTASVAEAAPQVPARSINSWESGANNLRAWLRGHAGLVVYAWMAGAVCCGLRLAAGAGRLHSWRVRGTPVPPQVAKMVACLVRRMHFGAAPAVLLVEGLPQALASGVLRPAILLPAAWVTQLDVQVLEAVIAHELAHLRRWDLAINWAQRVVEAVLFFHPVVWWCSKQIRAEREMCCDELALAAVDDRLGYAKALADLARRDVSCVEPAWAAGIGGSKMVLLERIRNVLGLSPESQGRMYGPTCALMGAAAASFAWIVVVAIVWAPATSQSPYTGNVQAQAGKNVLPPQQVTSEYIFGQGINSNAGLVSRIVPVGDAGGEPLRTEKGDTLQIAIKTASERAPSLTACAVDESGEITVCERKIHVDGITEAEVATAVRQMLATVPTFKQISDGGAAGPAVGVLDENIAADAAAKAEIAVLLVKPRVSAVQLSASRVPAEGSMRTLPSYTIEPPDILMIQVKQAVPKPPHHISVGDKLAILIMGESGDGGDKVSAKVSSGGTIELEDYPLHITVVGLSEEQAAALIHETFKDTAGEEFQVKVQIDSFAQVQPVIGEHLVRPDGMVNLGSYGQVQVSGLTVEKAQAAIEQHLSTFLIEPKTSVSVFAYNSKVYYIIQQGSGQGDSVMRLPVTGNETVLDALAQVKDLKELDKKAIFIARPLANSGKDQLLPVNWQAISKGTGTNYQVLPGDRIFVAELPVKPPISY